MRYCLFQVYQPSDEWSYNDSQWEAILADFDTVQDLNSYIERNGLVSDDSVKARIRQIKQVDIIQLYLYRINSIIIIIIVVVVVVVVVVDVVILTFPLHRCFLCYNSTGR